NGNGHYDVGEPYTDRNGNGVWDSNGFDYWNGHGVAIHPAVAANAGVSGTTAVLNLESQTRQLYARQLYCLMLLLVDMNYVAPWETIYAGPTGTGPETIEPELKMWMDAKKAEIEKQLTTQTVPMSAANAAAYADFI